MQQVKSLLARIAASPASTVLLTGETGTGKDLAAKAIHYNSDRAARRSSTSRVRRCPSSSSKASCSATSAEPSPMPGSRSAACSRPPTGGTVFLDEIGEMTPALQAKLLRFLEEKTFKRVGGLQDIRVDVRVIAATNRDLEEEVKAGKFREDLFYRLQVMPVRAAAVARAARRRRAARELLHRSL